MRMQVDIHILYPSKLGDPTDERRTRFQLEESPHALRVTKPIIPMHCYMVRASYPWNYTKYEGNPY